jgi:D-xylose transport system substrate-binding protein
MKSCKSLILFQVIALMVILNACTGESSFKIGLMLPNTVQDRFPKEREYFITKVKSLGGEVLAVDGQYNDALQIQQADELIAKGVKVLVVVANNKITAAAIVRSAHKSNIKVIAYERIIDNCDLDYFISFDNVKVGELMANYALKVKPNGKYMFLEGDKTDQNAVWVKQGHHNVLDPLLKSGQITSVYDCFVEDWSFDNANQTLKNYINLSGETPDVIISAYDGMTSGAIKAFEEYKLPLPISTGQNAEIEACQNIVKGRQSMTVYKPLKQEAEQAAILAVKIAKNEKIEQTSKTSPNGFKDVPSIFIDPISVDASNMKSTVIADGFLKESEVYSAK